MNAEDVRYATRRSRFRLGALAAGVLLLGAAGAVSAQTAEPDEEAAAQEELVKLQASLFLTGEKDDNVALQSPGFEQDDTVFRIRPNVGLIVPFWKESRFALSGSGDFRKGLDTDLNEKNGALTGLVELHFPGGLVTTISDSFYKGEFDLALFDPNRPTGTAEPGLSKSKDNTYALDVVYTPANRFSLQAHWEHSDDELTFENIDEKRELERAFGKAIVPVFTDWVVYAVAEKKSQDTDVRLDRVYDDKRYVGGVRWGDPDKLAIWAEAGRETVDYADSPDTDYRETVWLAGFDLVVAESTFASGSFGKDGYGNTVYQLALAQPDTEKVTSWRFLVQKASQNSFSNRAIARVFESTVVSGRFDRRFAERFLFGLEASWLRVEAERNPPILPPDPANPNLQKDDTSVARVEAGWIFADWVRLVGHYQYSKRESKNPSTRFKDRRIGASLVFEY